MRKRNIRGPCAHQPVGGRGHEVAVPPAPAALAGRQLLMDDALLQACEPAASLSCMQRKTLFPSCPDTSSATAPQVSQSVKSLGCSNQAGG